MSRAFMLDTLKELGSIPEVAICFLIRKNGDILASAGDASSVQLETFGLMSATIYGAAKTANEHLNKKAPDRIVIRAEDGDTVLKRVDDGHIMVLRTNVRENFGSVLKQMDEAVEDLVENW